MRSFPGFQSLKGSLLAGAATSLLLSSGALAQQSSDSQAVSSTNLESVIVTAGRATAGGGMVTAIDAPKVASVVSQDFIQDQTAGANPYQLLSLVPGVNATNRGATGIDRGQLTIRGFQSNQLGLSLDGVPINDSGTYNTFPQEYVDTENLSQIYLTPGAGDPDSPNIGATGGVVSMVIRQPSQDFHVSANAAMGQENYNRIFARVDTGVFGGNNTAYLSYSNADTNTWRGIGKSWVWRVDGEIVHEFDDNNKIALTVNYNVDNNAQYEAMTKAQISQFGYNFNYAPTFAPAVVPTAGVVVNDNNSATTGALLQRSNYSGLYYNPFKLLEASVKVNLRLADNLRFDLQPYGVYVYGACCVAAYLSESNTAVLGAPTDINNNGTTTDNLLYYNPGSQQQYRSGFITRLKWTLGIQELIFGFHYEYSNLHEYQPYIPIDRSTGKPVTYWPANQYALTVNGQEVYAQNRVTGTTTIHPFFEDTIHLFDDTLILTPGFQFSDVSRDGQNRLPLALRTAGGQVTPTNPSISQSKPLFNIGATYKISPESQLFGSIAQTERATDNLVLFLPGQNLSTIQPETAVDIEGGYRYHGDMFIGSIDGYHIHYGNREQYLFDSSVGNTVGKNIGSVSIEGIEGELGTVPIDGFTAYVSASYNRSSLLGNVPVGVAGVGNVPLPTKGKQLTDLPLYTLAGQLRYDADSYFVFVQPKYTGRRYSTLMNDEEVGGFATVDLGAGYNLPTDWTHGVKTGLEISVINVLDKQYLGAINFSNNALTTNGVPGSAPSYYQGAPRFISVKLRADL